MLLDNWRNWEEQKNRKVAAIPDHLLKGDLWDARIQPVVQKWFDGEASDPSITCLNIRRSDYYAGYIIHRLEKPAFSPIIAASLDAQIVINWEGAVKHFDPFLIMAEEMRHTHSWIMRPWLRWMTHWFIRVVHLDIWQPPEDGFWRNVWTVHRRIIDGGLMVSTLATGLPYLAVPNEVFDKAAKYLSGGHVPNMDCEESMKRYESVLYHTARHVSRAEHMIEDPGLIRNEMMRRRMAASVTRIDPKEWYIHSFGYDV